MVPWRGTFLFSMLRGAGVVQVARRKRPAGFWREKEKAAAFLEALAQRWCLKAPEDWAGVTTRCVLEEGGRGLLAEYGTLRKALEELRPEAVWDYFAMGKYPHGHWDTPEHVRLFMERLAAEYQVESPPDWRRVTWSHVDLHGGATLRKRFPNFVALLKGAFPEQTEWEESVVREKLPQGFWDLPDNRKRFLERVREDMAVRCADDWRKVSTKDIVAMGGTGMLSKYSTFEELLRKELPDEGWSTFDTRDRVSNGYWTAERIREHVESVRTTLKVKELDDWSSISLLQFRKASGNRSFHNQFPNFVELLQSVYPEHTFDPFDWQRLPRGYWKNITNQRRFLERFAFEHNIQALSDWRKVSYAFLERNGGRSLLRHYPSMLEMLQSVYPEHHWDILDRDNVSGRYWKDPQRQAGLLTQIAEKFCIKTPEDWYRVSLKQLQSMRVASYVKRHGGLYQLLKESHPEVPWEQSKFQTRDKRSTQRSMFLALRDLFEGEEIVEDFFHEELTRESGSGIQFDVFVPRLQVAFEYQGEHHFRDIPAFGTLELFQSRDKEKAKLCENFGIHLVTVPYWWDGSKQHLSDLASKQHFSILEKQLLPDRIKV